MARLVKDEGQYKVKDTGEVMRYEFEFAEYASIDDAVSSIGEAKALSLINRQEKVDKNNTMREKVKAENGHSTRPVMTAEQKAESKARARADRELLKLVKEQGITAEQLRKG